MSSQTPKHQRLEKMLRRRIQPDKDTAAIAEAKPVVSRETGVVVSVDTGPPVTVELTLGSSSTSLTGIQINPDLTLTTGDKVWVLMNGNDPLVFCKRS